MNWLKVTVSYIFVRHYFIAFLWSFFTAVVFLACSVFLCVCSVFLNVPFVFFTFALFFFMFPLFFFTFDLFFFMFPLDFFRFDLFFFMFALFFLAFAHLLSWKMALNCPLGSLATASKHRGVVSIYFLRKTSKTFPFSQDLANQIILWQEGIKNSVSHQTWIYPVLRKEKRSAPTWGHNLPSR